MLSIIQNTKVIIAHEITNNTIQEMTLHIYKIKPYINLNFV